MKPELQEKLDSLKSTLAGLNNFTPRFQMKKYDVLKSNLVKQVNELEEYLKAEAKPKRKPRKKPQSEGLDLSEISSSKTKK